MIKELELIIKECETRLDLLDKQINYCRAAGGIELNGQQWWSCYNRYTSAIKALSEYKQLHYTNCGSVDLRLPR